MSGRETPQERRARRLSEGVGAGLTGGALYHHVFGRPALPTRPERLRLVGEGYRAAFRLSRGCPYTCRGVVAGLSAAGGFPAGG